VIATDSAYDLVNSLTVVGSNSMTLNSISSFNHSISTVNSAPNNSYLYGSSTNLNYNEEHFQAQVEKKEYIKLLAQGICNVKCITEYVSYTNALVSYETRFFIFIFKENILSDIEAEQLQIDLNESGYYKKLDGMKR